MASLNKSSYRIVAIPGEGIGPEVVEASLTILRQVAQLEGFALTINYGWLGGMALEKLGSTFPPETSQQCEGSDGIVFGAVSQGGLLELRRHFDFFINLRPIRSCPYYDREIRRIAKVALQKAQERRGLLTVAHKENALPQIPWTRLVQEEATNFPDVVVSPMLVDNLAMQLVLNPQQFDVILAGNMFGDILSDIGGALVGSIGLLGSASLNNQGLGMYEAIHGTAPDIAGKGIANPLGTLAGCVLMLQQWGEIKAAQRILNAQERLLGKGYRTADLSPQNHEILVNTATLVDLFLEEISLEQPTQ
ncbi:isocitrate/isopropylmalate dehydrogenase family protein [Planktothrix agardhii]|uniref:isocitrate/isopropylmalate dehydrogenase family protein n=1 Tax=Planktothrix agardhii TaxID=1160 RepID=UPI001F3158D6|nr:isocitrate/isopropylmalate family dehydrogenase [Planktothrix agardhii]MCF3610485.1 isocitrate/isopropylmalate family dehydrogenase [Planktothrix agardhii 1027]